LVFLRVETQADRTLGVAVSIARGGIAQLEGIGANRAGRHHVYAAKCGVLPGSVFTRFIITKPELHLIGPVSSLTDDVKCFCVMKWLVV
jgi:hypothetical protein